MVACNEEVRCGAGEGLVGGTQAPGLGSALDGQGAKVKACYTSLTQREKETDGENRTLTPREIVVNKQFHFLKSSSAIALGRPTAEPSTS